MNRRVPATRAGVLAGKRANLLHGWKPHEQALSGMVSLRPFLHARYETGKLKNLVFTGFQPAYSRR